jgi:hypothetical protein
MAGNTAGGRVERKEPLGPGGLGGRVGLALAEPQVAVRLLAADRLVIFPL